MKASIKDFLPVAPNETAVLIKWDRETNHFILVWEGQQIHIESWRALSQALNQVVEHIADKDGFINASEIEEEDKPDNSVSGDAPPWLN